MDHANQVKHQLIEQMRARAAESTLCPSDPSEVARARWPNAKDSSECQLLMPTIREISQTLAQDGVLIIQAGGYPVAYAESHRGALMITRGPHSPDLGREASLSLPGFPGPGCSDLLSGSAFRPTSRATLFLSFGG